MSLAPLARILRQVIPDPFVIAAFLTLLAMGFALVGTGGVDPIGLLDAWVGGYVPEPGAKARGGLWSLLPFAMQMCLILVTGLAVAQTPPVRWLIDRVARIPRGTRSAVVLIGGTAMAVACVNWGLGLITGALLAREVGRRLHDRGIAVHYPLLAAAGYLGLAVWHGGLSGSAPLKLTTQTGVDEILGAELGARMAALPLTETLFSLRNLFVTPLAGVVMLGVLLLLVPRGEADFRPPPAFEDAGTSSDSEDPGGIAGFLERTPWVLLVFAGMIAVWILPRLWNQGLGALTLNTMNLLFLGIGLVLAGSPRAYLSAVREGARACAGIILQFPLYGGILALLLAGGVGEWVASVLPTSAAGLSASTFLSAGLLNLFVPSGGGQFALQGPLVLGVAMEHGIDPGRVVMALSWGDQWTNLFQPFWALPLLGITGTRAGDLLGPTLIAGLAVAPVFLLGAMLG